MAAAPAVEAKAEGLNTPNTLHGLHELDPLPVTVASQLDGKVILVTGGAGYIGSHTVLRLLKCGAKDLKVVVVDDLSNSRWHVIRRLRLLAGLDPKANDGPLQFHVVDLTDQDDLYDVFLSYGHFDVVIHMAGLKAVGESKSKPLLYYENNVQGTLNLLQQCNKFKCYNIVFSSSATVYDGQGTQQCFSERSGLRPNSVYGRTKLFVEWILHDLVECGDGHPWRVVILRYFNPIGAHASGLIGEDPQGPPNNLLPAVLRVASGKSKAVTVFGRHWATKDGTGQRDYIHVMDLVEGHILAITGALLTRPPSVAPPVPPMVANQPWLVTYNLGTGSSRSVFEVIEEVQRVSGKEIPVVLGKERSGDVAVAYAEASKAQRELGWVAKRTFADAVASAWKWQLHNPDGYQESLPDIAVPGPAAPSSVQSTAAAAVAIDQSQIDSSVST